jgi:hypothetical protein
MKCVPGVLAGRTANKLGLRFNNWLRRNADRRKNGFGRRAILQDDCLSSSRAVGRLAEQAEKGEFDLAPDPAYCLRRTEIMLSCYRKDEAHNPEIYNSAVSAILADGYPQDIVDYVTDPRTGLPSRNKFLPTVAEVREACEMLMEPRRQHEDKLKRRAEQLDARDEWLKPPTGPRKTAAEILKGFEEAAFVFGSQKKRITVSRDKFVRRYGISERDFDDSIALVRLGCVLLHKRSAHHQPPLSDKFRHVDVYGP